MLRGSQGPAQVTGVNRDKGFIGQGLRDLLGLPKPLGVEANVDLSLDAVVDIPVGFAMSNGQDARAVHEPSVVSLWACLQRGIFKIARPFFFDRLTT